MTEEQALPQDLLESPKPVFVEISTEDIQMLYACQTSPKAFMNCILAKLKDAGAPIEGVLDLRPAHGKIVKVKDHPTERQSGFVYGWISDEYAFAIANAPKGMMV